MQMMESDELENCDAKKVEIGTDSQSAVNSLILDYYKKFGRKRDLEQFFSLSTAQSDIKDPASPFWRKMKSENDSSDSEAKKSESSREICRISIKCSVPEPYSSQDEDQSQTKTDSVSPPIIIEEVATNTSRHTDDESVKSDDNNSQRSFDALLLDTSTQKPFSPTSSINSQRKLEWDSLADVGYANESDRKTSASSLSTLERLALKQQYSNNDTKENIGPPTSHSTPLEENDKGKSKRGVGKKTTKIYKKDIDVVELNVPSTEANPTQSINVNLTKHISFNVEKDGGVTIDNIKRDISVNPEKKPIETEGVFSSHVRSDKEIQTSLIRTQEKSTTHDDTAKAVDINAQKIPIMISVNTLRRRLRRKKSKAIRKRLQPTKSLNIDKDILPQEKSGEQLSEAESFEYMPGHIYNQNHMKNPEKRPANMSAGNKSSLESSGALTTDSSKGSKHSFTKDLEKSIELLKKALQKRFDDSEVKNKLIKEIVSRLLKSRYRDDDSVFLSGLTFSSKKLGLYRGYQTTSSTSDANISEENKSKRPRKSILRVDKFNSNAVASTSQSVPNLLTAAHSDTVVPSNLIKAIRSNTDSDVSSKGKNSSDNNLRTSSEELYQKYLEALKREEAYKRHLRDKELFLKQKLTSSENTLKVPVRQEVKITNRIKDLMKDLTRNNYDDGSGDASKLEGGSNSNVDYERFSGTRNQRSHSVFTLSSSPSECHKKPNIKKKQGDIRDQNEAGPSNLHPNHYCCCPHHYTNSRIGYADSSVQVNIKCQYEDTCSQVSKKSALKPGCDKCKDSPRNRGHVISDDATGDIKYVCLCNEKPLTSTDLGDNFLIYKCARLTNRGVQLENTSAKISDIAIQCGDTYTRKNDDINLIRPPCKMTDNESSSSDNFPYLKKQSKSSQTNLLVKMLYQEYSDTNTYYSDGKTSKDQRPISPKGVLGSECQSKDFVHEATRCLQTEISINPKITDPSLADINIINESDCAKLIGEQYRKVEPSYNSKNTDSSLKAKGCTEVYASSEFGKNSFKNEDIMYDKKCCADFKDLEIGSGNEPLVTVNRDKFTIPIQGTNMTLMVNLGSLELKEASKENVDQACVTDKADVVEQATCIFDECSKSVQYECPKAATTNNHCSTPIDHTSNKINKEIGTQSEFCNNVIGNNIKFEEDIKCNTYPKNIQTNSRKPFSRSNTDTDKIEQVWVQTDIKNDCGTQEKNTDGQNWQKATYESEMEHVQKNPKYITEVDKSPNCDCGCEIGEDQSCKMKPFGRSNTDTDKIKKISCYDQIKKGCGTQDIDGQFWQKTTIESGMEHVQKNPACNTEINKSPRYDCGSKTSQDKSCNKKDIGTQNNLPSVSSSKTEKDLISRYSENEKVSKNSCSEDQNYIKRKKSPRRYTCGDKRKDYSPPKVSKGFEKSSKNIGSNERNKCIIPEPKKSPRKCTCGSEKFCKNITCQDTEKVVFSPTIGSDSEKSLNVCNDAQISCLVSKAKKPSPKSLNICSQEQNTPKPKDCYLPALSSDSENFPKGLEESTKHVCQKSQDSIQEPPTAFNRDLDKSSKKKVTKSAGSAKPCASSSDREDAKYGKDTCGTDQSKDPIIDMIREITKQYSKTDIEKHKRKKCFKEIMTVLHYLLETDESDIPDQNPCGSCTDPDIKPAEKDQNDGSPNKSPEKSIQTPANRPKSGQSKICTESSEIPASTDLPCTSSDSTTCKVLNKIKKECEKYHQKRCKSGKKCYSSSTTSVNCDQCKKVHHCFCKGHKCRRSKNVEKLQKKCVAYNLIIQTSESMISEEKSSDKKCRPLREIVVKVPKYKPFENICKETSCKKETVYKVEKPRCSPRCENRSRSCPNASEISSTEELLMKSQQCTVREYLERNRPDFVENCTQRQTCLKFVSDMRANERSVKRDLLSLHVERQPDLTTMSSDELRRLALEIGLDLRRKRPAPKLISEREMKKHSEKIYKTLPEVVQKKEEKKKENIKKTNLLMANIFKKNLQKQTLRGSVNLSNYNTVIKI